MDLVWPARIGHPTKKLILLRLADRAHQDGAEARPGIRSLSRECGTSERQVQRYLRDLEREGWISLQREARQHRPRWYRINLTKLTSRGDVSVTPDRNSAVTWEASMGVTDTTSEHRSDDTGVTQSVRQKNDNSPDYKTAPPPGEARETASRKMPASQKNRSRPARGAKERDIEGRCEHVLTRHGELFRELTGQTLLLANRKREALRLLPALEAHGLQRMLELQAQFFGSLEGWWVDKHSYGIGSFVGAINALVAAAVVEHRDEVDPDWRSRWAQKVKQ